MRRSPRHEPPVLVADLELGLDRHLADRVEQPEHGLPRGLRAAVCQGDRLPENNRARTPGRGHVLQVLAKAVAGPQRGVDQNDHIQEREIAGRAKKNLVREVDGQTLAPQRRVSVIAAGGDQARPPGP